MATTIPNSRFYVDFVPSSQWIADQKYETLLVNLPGFKKEHIKVQIDNFRNLRTSGERPLDANRWSRFSKDFYVPETLNISEIRAKFEDATLYVILPKLITPAEPPELPVISTQQTAATKEKASGNPEGAHQKQEEKVGNKAEAEHDEQHGDRATVGAEKKRLATEEKVIGSQSGSVTPAKGTEKARSGEAGEMWKQRKLLLNIVAAIMVLVGLGLCVNYKVKKAFAVESSNDCI